MKIPSSRPGWLLACLLAPFAALAQPTADLVTLPVRAGVTLTYLLVVDPALPVEQVVVLFSGGSGNVPMGPASTRPAFAERGNFLVRTRYLWAGGGFASAVVGVPSDRAETGLDDAFRSGRTHADDIDKVIADLRQRFPGASLTLVGTSRGTVSAASVARHLPGRADRVVLSATVFDASRSGNGLAGFDYASIRSPLLFVHHADDACRQTPYHPAKRLAATYPLVTVSGGRPPESGPCDPLSAHGFFGKEVETVEAVKDWIRGRSFATQVH
jgi:alpha/beta superfamily hydrolase